MSKRLDLLELIFSKMNENIPLQKPKCDEGMQLALQNKNIKLVEFFLRFFLPMYDDQNLKKVMNLLEANKLIACLKKPIMHQDKKEEMQHNAKYIICELINKADNTDKVRKIYEGLKRMSWLYFLIRLHILYEAKNKIIELCRDISYEENSLDRTFLKVQLQGNLFLDLTHSRQYEMIMEKKKTKECWCLVL